MNVSPGMAFWKPALVIGIISVLGSLIPGILDQFQNFLLIIGSVFIPAFALMIVDYFLIDRGRFTHQNLIAQAGQLPIFHPVAFLCYAAGAALAYYWNWVAPLSFGASLPVFVVTGLLYYIATRWQRRTGGASA
ncbi:hypothetical protein [Chromohalobacter japonicus]|uniref:hypothetical protein n=1 Tax=Chromohalobacter japonicus TaxID=223900 RepID=UPI001FF46675|nr:hypothetical protein [Chromohalobacter japonicus]MCK0753493.1 hypothetical protein [Chromohalobacter japonicus]